MLFCKSVTHSGVVLEQDVFPIFSKGQNLWNAEPKKSPARSQAEKDLYNAKQSQKRCIRNMNQNFTPDDYFVTTTMDKDHYVDTFPEAINIRENYIKRLQRVNPKVKIMAFMGRGKRTKRIHFHFVISGVSRRAISEKWFHGNVKNIEHLREHNYYKRIDHGADFTGLAIYLFDHWTEEQGKGKRWRQTTNLQQPEKDKPTLAKRTYSETKPPLTPKGYMLVDTIDHGNGHLYFKYVIIPQKPGAKRKC